MYRRIVYVDKELGAAELELLEGENLHCIRDIGQLQQAGPCERKDCLVLAASDETIQAVKALGVAFAAYANPKITGQTYAGAPVLIEGLEEVDHEFLERIYNRFHGIPWEIAQTKRCQIRELVIEDLPALMELYEQPGVAYRMDDTGRRLPGFVEPLYDYEGELEYQKNYVEHMYQFYGYGMWLVFERKSGKLIGRAGIEHREYDGEIEYELGYVIHPDYWGQGLATEVCAAILTYAREYIGCEKINLLTDKENPASIAVARKLGFKQIGTHMVKGSALLRFVKDIV